jgi:hypothetical protein
VISNYNIRAEKMMKKKEKIAISRTREGIGDGRQPAGQVEGEQWRGKWRGKGEKGLGTGEELQHHQNTKPEHHCGKSVEWDLHPHCEGVKGAYHTEHDPHHH